jgi:hypothetical protein
MTGKRAIGIFINLSVHEGGKKKSHKTNLNFFHYIKLNHDSPDRFA